MLLDLNSLPGNEAQSPRQDMLPPPPPVTFHLHSGRQQQEPRKQLVLIRGRLCVRSWIPHPPGPQQQPPAPPTSLVSFPFCLHCPGISMPQQRTQSIPLRPTHLRASCVSTELEFPLLRPGNQIWKHRPTLPGNGQNPLNSVQCSLKPILLSPIHLFLFP